MLGSEPAPSGNGPVLTCAKVEDLAKNCYGFFRGRAFNYYYFKTSSSPQCDLLMSMDSTCRELMRHPLNQDNQIKLQNEALEYVNLVRNVQKAPVENNVWEYRKTPIDSWKTSHWVLLTILFVILIKWFLLCFWLEPKLVFTVATATVFGSAGPFFPVLKTCIWEGINITFSCPTLLPLNQSKQILLPYFWCIYNQQIPLKKPNAYCI